MKTQDCMGYFGSSVECQWCFTSDICEKKYDGKKSRYVYLMKKAEEKEETVETMETHREREERLNETARKRFVQKCKNREEVENGTVASDIPVLFTEEGKLASKEERTEAYVKLVKMGVY